MQPLAQLQSLTLGELIVRGAEASAALSGLSGLRHLCMCNVAAVLEDDEVDDEQEDEDEQLQMCNIDLLWVRADQKADRACPEGYPPLSTANPMLARLPACLPACTLADMPVLTHAFLGRQCRRTAKRFYICSSTRPALLAPPTLPCLALLWRSASPP